MLALIGHFTIVCLVANRSEARVDFVVIQNLLVVIMLTSFLSLSCQGHP